MYFVQKGCELCGMASAFAAAFSPCVWWMLSKPNTRNSQTEESPFLSQLRKATWILNLSEPQGGKGGQ